MSTNLPLSLCVVNLLMFLSSTSLPHFDISRPGWHKHFEISYDNHYKQIIKFPISVVGKKKSNQN